MGAIVLAIAAAALFIALLTFGVAGQAPNSAIDDSLAQGRAASAPAFDLAVLQRGELGAGLDRRLAPALADGRLGTNELRGIPVVLNIWASWCDPCRAEAALLERAWRTEGRPGGTLFLGLDVQDLTGDAHAYIHSYGVDYPSVRDPGNDVPLSYGATGIPETYFISARGQVVDHVIGVISPRELRDGLIAARRGQPLGVRSGGARRPSR
jgi:cytochrome c biogenesis protein CcmG, thiol:disulfide interchange protein DsbE